MLRLTFVTHATTLDNEAKRASGFYDVELSPLGVQQAQDMGRRYADTHFAAIFCSNLQRSYRTAQIAFAGRPIPIIQDMRLRECDYGDLTRQPTAEIEAQKVQHIRQPFPNGESFTQAVARIGAFLSDLRQTSHNQPLLIVGHRATQYGLEYWLRGISLEEVITAPWSWQPGWVYKVQRADDESNSCRFSL